MGFHLKTFRTALSSILLTLAAVTGFDPSTAHATSDPLSPRPVLVVLAYNGDHGTYSRIVERMAIEQVRQYLTPHYEQFSYVMGKQATPDALDEELLKVHQENPSSPIDLFIFSHANYTETTGPSLALAPSPGTTSGSITPLWIWNRAQGNPAFAKLRIVYQLGCHSARMDEAWLGVGAKSAIGHRGYHGLPPLFLPTFLQGLGQGQTLQEAIGRAFQFSVKTAAELDGYLKPIGPGPNAVPPFSEAGVWDGQPRGMGSNWGIRSTQPESFDWRWVTPVWNPPQNARDPIVIHPYWEPYRLRGTPLSKVDVRYREGGLMSFLVNSGLKGGAEFEFETAKLPELPVLLRRHGKTAWDLIQNWIPTPVDASARFSHRAQLNQTTLRRLIPLGELAQSRPKLAWFVRRWLPQVAHLNFAVTDSGAFQITQVMQADWEIPLPKPERFIRGKADTTVELELRGNVLTAKVLGTQGSSELPRFAFPTRIGEMEARIQSFQVNLVTGDFSMRLWAILGSIEVGARGNVQNPSSFELDETPMRIQEYSRTLQFSWSVFKQALQN